MKCPECGQADLRVLPFAVGAHGHPVTCPACMNAFYLTNGSVWWGETLPAEPAFELEPNWKTNMEDFPLTGSDVESLPLLTDVMKPHKGGG